MKRPKRTLKEVKQAIKGSGGIKTVIASRLGVERQTVDNYLRRWKAAQEAYEAETDVNLDVAESVIVGNIRQAAMLQQNGAGIVDSSDAWKYLNMKGKERGYNQKVDVEQSGNVEIVIKYADD